MEAFFLYVVKASGLLTAFFLAYHLLLRKETFFNANRWYLLLGLFTALLLPLYTFTKVIYVDPRPQLQYPVEHDTVVPVVLQQAETIDWTFVLTCLYIGISLVLFVKVVVNLASVVRLLSQKKKLKKGAYSLVSLTENLAPFSFFNYIAVNPDLYSDEELESILLHEKVHSREKHSADVLTANLFCVLFWFNPFMWLYKKAIIQNLEYIADQKAIKKCANKTNYQKALLRVVTHQNYLSITNHFNQSLIKKRIVMLNTNQSKKRNSLKYLFVLPVLICFVIFFQMKVIAQEKFTASSINKTLDKIIVRMEINKHTTDAEMKKEKEVFKKEFDADLKFSKVKRNPQGEITSIKVDLKTGKGKAETYQFSGTEPIKPFSIFASKDKNGIVSVGYGKPEKTKIFRNDDKTVVISSSDADGYDFSFEIPEFPELPELPELPEMPEFPEFPDFPDIPTPPTPAHADKTVIIKKDKNGKSKTKVIVNGEVVVDTDEVVSDFKKDNNKHYSFYWNSDSDNAVIAKEDFIKLRGEALEKAKAEMARIRPELEKSRKEIQKSRDNIELSRADIEHSKKEIELAKKELEKARAELEKARVELEKAAQKKQ